jgi:demethylmenaquinone methyltransferase/2-methoxy-6-polyprenyl-1,4-benzoquinol methylase
MGPVIGCDFSFPMVKIGKRKADGKTNLHAVHVLCGDANDLPFRDASFDAVVSAFVLRNLSDIPRGLGEMRRVLRRGGVLGILDFAMPRIPLLGRVYRLYFSRVLPRLGTLISGVRGPYRYLPDSVKSFPTPEELKRIIAGAGFSQVDYKLYTAGIAVLFLANARE